MLSEVAGAGTLHALGRFCTPFHAPAMQPLAEERQPFRVVPAALLTVREAAEHLRVSSATVYKLCERGRLRYVRISTHSIRIAAADLEAFAARGGVLR